MVSHKCSSGATIKKARNNGEAGQEARSRVEAQPQLKYALLR